MFDITQLEIEDSAKYQVTDAKGEPQFYTIDGAIDSDDKPQQFPVMITITSPGTKKAAVAIFKRDEARSARVLGAMGGKASKRTEDDELRERADFLASVTESLDGFTYSGGARALYLNLKLGHIADGVEKFFNDRGNFYDGSAQTAPSTSDTQLG